MNIGPLAVVAFVLVLVLAGCLAPTPSIPTPTPVPIATWVAQGIPSDLVILYTDFIPFSWGHHATIQISADGTAAYACVGGDCLEGFIRKLSPEALRRVVLAFRNVSTTLRQLRLDFSVRTCVAGDA
jgi:hypothetical protein